MRPGALGVLAALMLLGAGCQRHVEAAASRIPMASSPPQAEKAQALAQEAIRLCARSSRAHRSAGARTARAAAAAASAEFALEPPERKLAQRWVLLPAAAQALAECGDPGAAKAFLNAAVDRPAARIMLNRLADMLITGNQFALADRVAPIPDPHDPQDLTDAALRILREGRARAARNYALQANALLAASAQQPGGPALVQNAVLAGQLTAVLADVGEYQAAMGLVRLQSPGDQEQDFLRLMLHVIDARERRGIAEVLPVVSTLFAAGPASALEGANDLAEVVRRLAIAGFRAQAIAANRALDERRTLLPVWQALSIQADLGDVDGAIAAADRLGPLTRPAPLLAGAFAAGMDLRDSAASGLAPERARELASRARADRPAQTSGLRAEALAAIATDLADAGRLDDALKAVAPLETVAPDVVAGSRDYALAAIAQAQAKAGRAPAARLTIGRIYQPTVRAEATRRLAEGAKPQAALAPSA